MPKNPFIFAPLCLFLSTFLSPEGSKAELFECGSQKEQGSVFADKPLVSEGVKCVLFREQNVRFTMLPNTAFDSYKDGLVFDIEKNIPIDAVKKAKEAEVSKVSKGTCPLARNQLAKTPKDTKVAKKSCPYSRKQFSNNPKEPKITKKKCKNMRSRTCPYKRKKCRR